MTETKELNGEQLLDLWLTVPRLPIAKRERAVLDSGTTERFHFESPVVPRGEFELALTTWGEAQNPLALLMHGWGGHRAQLGMYVEPLLAAGWRAAAFDAPAHGDTEGTQASGYQMAKAILAVTKQIGAPRAVVAHSLGCMSTTLAIEEGLQTEKLVMFGPIRRLEDTVEQFLKANSFPLEWAARLKQTCVEQFGGADVWERTALDLQLPRFNLPGLVIHDRNDEVTPYISGAAVARSWKAAKLITTRELGHRGVLRDPDVLQQVLDFVIH
jgi:pimeloyl-ACP methyl ester carboxylesterase